MEELDRISYNATYNSAVWFGRLWMALMIAIIVLVGSEWILVQSSSIWGHGSLYSIIEPALQETTDRIHTPISLALVSFFGLMMSLEYYRWSRFVWLPAVYITHLMVIGSLF